MYNILSQDQVIQSDQCNCPTFTTAKLSSYIQPVSSSNGTSKWPFTW